MDKNIVKISIILPIYNVEKYLSKCIDSVINQTLKDIEIILATDGPESCDKICEQYAQNDPRIKIIYHPGSYGKAVNQGIDIAKGEYIGIVETDDWIDLQMYEKLYKKAIASSADIAKCGFYNSYEHEHQQSTIMFAEAYDVFTIRDNPSLIGSAPSIWSAIYKKEFLTKNNIRFIEQKGVSYIDSPFFVETIVKAEKIAAVKEPLYFYYNDNPAQSVKSKDKIIDSIIAERYLYEKLLNDKSLYDEFFESLIWTTSRHLEWNYERLPDENKQKFRDEAKAFFKSFNLEDLNYTYFAPAHKKFLDSLIKGENWETYEKNKDSNSSIYYLFSLIPILRKKQVGNRSIFYLFGFFPLFKIKNYWEKTEYYLFCLFLIFRIKRI